MLSREELVISPFGYSGRRFGWLRPVVFPLKLRGFPRKKDWCPCVDLLACRVYVLREHRTCPPYLQISTSMYESTQDLSSVEAEVVSSIYV